MYFDIDSSLLLLLLLLLSDPACGLPCKSWWVIVCVSRLVSCVVRGLSLRACCPEAAHPWAGRADRGGAGQQQLGQEAQRCKGRDDDGVAFL